MERLIRAEFEEKFLNLRGIVMATQKTRSEIVDLNRTLFDYIEFLEEKNNHKNNDKNNIFNPIPSVYKSINDYLEQVIDCDLEYDERIVKILKSGKTAYVINSIVLDNQKEFEEVHLKQVNEQINKKLTQ